MENAVSLAVAGGSAAGASLLLAQASDISLSSAKQLSQQSVASTPSVMSAAACSPAAETGLQSQAATRRLLGQGLMNIASSASAGAIVQPPPLSRMPVSPASVPALHPNSSTAAAAATGFTCSGRQIKGQLL